MLKRTLSCAECADGDSQILSFLGAIHWGFEWAQYGGRMGYPRYAIGVMAPAIAWPSLLLPIQYSLIAQFLVSTAKTLPLPASLTPDPSTSGSADEDPETMLFRSSYALTALLGLAFWGGRAVARGTKRWRARIRDEVYLVGERLHNFGEGRPPVGSATVGRRGRRDA